MSKSKPISERSCQLLDRRRSILLIVDVQVKLIPVIATADDVRGSVKFLLDVAECLEVPVVVTEQYPSGLGHSVPEIADHSSVNEVAEKLDFSSAESLLGSQCYASAMATGDTRKPQVVIVGIETHICVLQSALDLVANGVDVFVVEDAVGSRRSSDHGNALRRIQAAGGSVCVSESVAFEWCQRAGTEEFKKISKLVRTRPIGTS